MKMRKIGLAVLVLAIVALSVLNLVYDNKQKPDVIYPMANQHIEWQYAGK